MFGFLKIDIRRPKCFPEEMTGIYPRDGVLISKMFRKNSWNVFGCWNNILAVPGNWKGYDPIGGETIWLRADHFLAMGRHLSGLVKLVISCRWVALRKASQKEQVDILTVD